MCSDMNLDHTDDHSHMGVVTHMGGGLTVPDATSPCSVTKTLLAKLTIRKPSILSITSNLSSPGINQINGAGSLGGSLTDIHDIKSKVHRSKSSSPTFSLYNKGERMEACAISSMHEV